MKRYLMLTKPGIIFGNGVTAAGGFALASRGKIDFVLFLAMLVGLSLIIASACVFNNYIDRVTDEKMARTRLRPLVTGTISPAGALTFAVSLGLVGAALLSVATNFLTLVVALTGFFIYVVVYTIWKYQSTLGTVIGSAAGAVPPVVGYAAVTGHLDVAAFLIFSIVVLWQMPHFFAIAIYRSHEYAAASIPVLPLIKGTAATKVQMVFYVVAFGVTATMLSFCGYTGTIYLATAAALGLGWLVLSLWGFKASNDVKWARQMFLFSLVSIMVLCLMILVDSRPPL